MAAGTGSELEGDFVNQEHIDAFAQALLSEGDAGHVLPTGDPRPLRISAASDFAPIHEPVKKRSMDGDVKLRSVDRGVPEGFMYWAVRWPLLWLVSGFILFDFALYVFIRQVVNMLESAIAWRGRSGVLRKHMRSATTYAQWKRSALELDRFRDSEAWKSMDASAFYDWRIIQRVIAALKVTRGQGDAYALMGVLNLCLKNNFAGVENFSLYSQSFYGTKHLVENYYLELQRAIQYLESSSLDPKVKRTFYRVAAKNFGKTALCLSGGASFAYYHFGVIKALLDHNLLPNIISGTSAGGLVAALVCTRTNEELKKLLVPELAHRITACDEPWYVWLWRLYRTGARFDAVQWASKAMFFTRGSLTFREAFERTGKVLNISVVPFDQHSPAQLLNYITAPDCLIWSALLASAAVPGILRPVFLMQKLPDGSLHPWSWGYKFRDGSLRVDIPLQQLHSLFNVTYPIVSQVNPHVHLFHYGSKGTPGRPTAYRSGRGWRGGFLLSAAEHIVDFADAEILRDLNLLPHFLGQDWSSVFLQPFHGAATIWPKSRFLDWPRILTDPDPQEMSRLLFHMISNRICIERAIARGRQRVRTETGIAPESDVPSADESIRLRGVRQRILEHSEPSDADENAPRDRLNRSRKWRSSSQELRKGLAHSQSSVLETYSPEWYRFLHDSETHSMAGTPDTSGLENFHYAESRTNRRYQPDAMQDSWRRPGSMSMDRGRAMVPPPEESWDAETNPDAEEHAVDVCEDVSLTDKLVDVRAPPGKERA